WYISRWRDSPFDPCRPGNPQFTHRRKTYALPHNMTAILFYFLQKSLINRRHYNSWPLIFAVLRRQCRKSLGIIAFCPFDLEFHQAPEVFGFTRMEDILGGYPKTNELILRKINTITARIFADIAYDVGELECKPQIFRILQGLRVAIAKNLRRAQPHHACHMVAV